MSWTPDHSPALWLIASLSRQQKWHRKWYDGGKLVKGHKRTSCWYTGLWLQVIAANVTERVELYHCWRKLRMLFRLSKIFSVGMAMELTLSPPFSLIISWIGKWSAQAEQGFKVLPLAMDSGKNSGACCRYGDAWPLIVLPAWSHLCCHGPVDGQTT